MPKTTKKDPTIRAIRKKVLAIAYKALGTVDAKANNDLQSMDVETLTVCVGLMLKAKDQAIKELREKSKPRCEQRTHDRRSTRCRWKGHA